ERPLIVQNLRLGESTFSGGVSGLECGLSLPVAALGPKSARASPIIGVLNGLLVRAVRNRAEEVATLDANLSIVRDGPMHAHIGLKNVPPRLADEMLGRAGLVSGALGDTASLTIEASRPAGA